MGRQPRAHALLDVFHQLGRRRVSVGQDDERLDDVAAQLVGAADHRGLGYRRMLQQAVFHLAGTDAMSGAGNDIVFAADEPEISLLVPVAHVTGAEPVADELLPRCRLVLPVA